MGNSNCSDNTASKQKQSKKMPLKTEMSDEAKEAARIGEEFDRKLRGIEHSLQHDKSVPNLVDQLANIIEMEGLDKMACVKRIVESMGSEWQNLMQSEEQITRAVGAKEMNKLKDLRGRYFSLLLKTRTVIVGLLEQSEIQQENVQDSLRVLYIARKRGDANLGDDDKQIFDESIAALSRWIDQSELVQITEQWNVLCTELEAQKTRFQQYFEKYKKKSLWTRIALGLGAIIVAGTVIGLIIASSGAAAPVAAAAAGAAGTKVTIGTTAAVSAAIGFTAGTGLVGGALCYGYYVRPLEMAHKIEKISNLLKEYIKFAQKMQDEVNKMNATNKKIDTRLKFDYQTCVKMSQSLNKIQTYLNEYIKHGNGVIAEIEKACQEFMK